jgi:hypothetical protein
MFDDDDDYVFPEPTRIDREHRLELDERRKFANRRLHTLDGPKYEPSLEARMVRDNIDYKAIFNRSLGIRFRLPPEENIESYAIPPSYTPIPSHIPARYRPIGRRVWHRGVPNRELLTTIQALDLINAERDRRESQRALDGEDDDLPPAPGWQITPPSTP